jgi:hypothetical protein
LCIGNSRKKNKKEKYFFHNFGIKTHQPCFGLVD